MNENLQVGSPTTRVPKQVAAALKRAQDALKPTPEEAPDPAAQATDPPQSAAVPSFVVPPGYVLFDEVLKAPSPEKDASRDYWHARAQAEANWHRQSKEQGQRRIADLEAKLADLVKKNAELVKSHPAAKPAVDITKRFTPQQIEAMGEDNCRAILEAAVAEGEERAKQYIDSAVKPLQKKQEEDREAQDQERYQAFLVGLTEGFPNWEAVDRDPRWQGNVKSFCAQRDPNSGMIRQRIIDAAKAERDPKPIIRLLNQFVESLQPAPVPTAPPETPHVAEGGGEVYREDTETPNPNKLLTDAEIKNGYDRRKKHRILADGTRVPLMSDEAFKTFEAQVKATMVARGRA